MDIENIIYSDINEVFRLYKIASNYQKTKKAVVVWPDFKRSLIETEIKENRQFKMLVGQTLTYLTFQPYSIFCHMTNSENRSKTKNSKALSQIDSSNSNSS